MLIKAAEALRLKDLAYFSGSREHGARTGISVTPGQLSNPPPGIETPPATIHLAKRKKNPPLTCQGFTLFRLNTLPTRICLNINADKWLFMANIYIEGPDTYESIRLDCVSTPQWSQLEALACPKRQVTHLQLEERKTDVRWSASAIWIRNLFAFCIG